MTCCSHSQCKTWTATPPWPSSARTRSRGHTAQGKAPWHLDLQTRGLGCGVGRVVSARSHARLSSRRGPGMCPPRKSFALCLSQGPTQLLPETAHSQPWLHTGLAAEALKGRIPISRGGPGGHRIFGGFCMSPLCSPVPAARHEGLT